MDYNLLVDKLRNHEIGEEEAKEYLGEELVSQIEGIRNLCKDNNLRVYAHGTDTSLAPNIVKRGLTLFHGDMTLEEYKEKTRIDDPEAFFSNWGEEDIYRYDIDDVGEREEYELYADYDERVVDTEFGHLSQHLTPGFPTYTDFVGRFIAHNMGYPCSAMVLYAFPPNTTLESDLLSKSYVRCKYVMFDQDGYYSRESLNSLFCLGYLDVPNRKFVFNEQFGIHNAFHDSISLDGLMDETPHK